MKHFEACEWNSVCYDVRKLACLGLFSVILIWPVFSRENTYTGARKKNMEKENIFKLNILNPVVGQNDYFKFKLVDQKGMDAD